MMNVVVHPAVDGVAWQIVMAQLPLISGLVGHNFLVLLDSDAKVVSEINGLAIGNDGSVRAIGWRRSDQLRVVVSEGACYYREDLSKMELYSGPTQTVKHLWHKAEAEALVINHMTLNYPFLGLGKNSNSVASTLIRAMGLVERRFPQTALIDFGRGKILD